MDHALPLDKMSVSDKLAVLEQLWDDLADNAADVPVPGWHADVLSTREMRVGNGQSQFVPLDEMKDRLRKGTR